MCNTLAVRAVHLQTPARWLAARQAESAVSNRDENGNMRIYMDNYQFTEYRPSVPPAPGVPFLARRD
jgi:hypothetical protein